MDISFDSNTMVGLIAALIALCYGLQFWDKEQSNLLDKVCRGLFNEIIRDHQWLIDKVKATGVNRNSIGVGQKLHRTLRCCNDKYQTSTFVYFISGMSIVSTVYCLFLIALPFFVGSVFHEDEVNIIVVIGQVALATMFVPYLFFRKELLIRYVRWNMLHFSLAIIAMVLSVVMTCIGLYLHVLNSALLMVLYRVAVCIPFVPMVLASGYVFVFWIREIIEIKNLEKVYDEYKNSLH
jgi:hypothetical protein